MKIPSILLSALLSASLMTACNGDSTSGSNAFVDVDENGYTNVDQQQLSTTLDQYALGELNAEETADLTYMREEEKLAHDVYIALYDAHGMQVFNNIASSEQTHTDAVLTLLERYSLPDPAVGNAEGVFTDTDLQTLYNDLVNEGFSSSLNALMVGAAIEEIDIIDLQDSIARTVENDDLVLLYENLMKGSRNHLRAFVRNLTSAGMAYTPRYLSQGEYDAIINADMETGSN